jgi:exopolysaccharide biosynthesis protein
MIRTFFFFPSQAAYLLLFLLSGSVFSQNAEVKPVPETPDWTAVFEGVQTAHAVSEIPRRQQVFAVKIDTTAEGISFFSTPRTGKDDKSGEQETVRQRTNEFLKEHHLQVAINANFFTVPKGEKYSLPGVADLLGLAISEGNIVSLPVPDKDFSFSATFLVSKNGQVSLEDCSGREADFSGIETAVAGNIFILREGKVIPQTNRDIHPRTLCGISQDSRYVVWVVIDGRRKGYSEGAAYEDSAQWLRYFGVWDGLNLDGGGSTTLVVQGKDNEPMVLNQPSDNSLRYNANNIGVRALPLIQTQHP